MLKWLCNSSSRKPSFSLDGLATGDEVVLQICGSNSFTGKIYSYTVEIGSGIDAVISETALAKKTWYARASINGGPWILSSAFQVT